MDEDRRRHSRRSSLKKTRTPLIEVDAEDETATNPDGKRRVSFASSNFIKQFAPDEENNTVWDTTYEEALNRTDSNSQNTNSTVNMELTCVTEVRKRNVNRSTINFNETGGEDMTLDFSLMVEEKDNLACNNQRDLNTTSIDMEFTQPIPVEIRENVSFINKIRNASHKNAINFKHAIPAEMKENVYIANPEELDKTFFGGTMDFTNALQVINKNERLDMRESLITLNKHRTALLKTNSSKQLEKSSFDMEITQAAGQINKNCVEQVNISGLLPIIACEPNINSDCINRRNTSQPLEKITCDMEITQAACVEPTNVSRLLPLTAYGAYINNECTNKTISSQHDGSCMIKATMGQKQLEKSVSDMELTQAASQLPGLYSKPALLKSNSHKQLEKSTCDMEITQAAEQINKNCAEQANVSRPLPVIPYAGCINGNISSHDAFIEPKVYQPLDETACDMEITQAVEPTNVSKLLPTCGGANRIISCGHDGSCMIKSTIQKQLENSTTDMELTQAVSQLPHLYSKSALLKANNQKQLEESTCDMEITQAACQINKNHVTQANVSRPLPVIAYDSDINSGCINRNISSHDVFIQPKVDQPSEKITRAAHVEPTNVSKLLPVTAHGGYINTDCINSNMELNQAASQLPHLYSKPTNVSRPSPMIAYDTNLNADCTKTITSQGSRCTIEADRETHFSVTYEPSDNTSELPVHKTYCVYKSARESLYNNEIAALQIQRDSQDFEEISTGIAELKLPIKTISRLSGYSDKMSTGTELVDVNVTRALPVVAIEEPDILEQELNLEMQNFDKETVNSNNHKSEFSRIISEGDYNPPKIDSKLLILSDNGSNYLANLSFQNEEMDMEKDSLVVNVHDSNEWMSFPKNNENANISKENITLEPAVELNIEEETIKVYEPKVNAYLETFSSKLMKFIPPKNNIAFSKPSLKEGEEKMQKLLDKLFSLVALPSPAVDSLHESNSVSCLSNLRNSCNETSTIESSEDHKAISDHIEEYAERNKSYWRILEKSEGKYSFSTMSEKLAFTVSFNEENGLVHDIETKIENSVDVDPMNSYVLNNFQKQLGSTSLASVLGDKYDILALLDYVTITMKKMLQYLKDYKRLYATNLLKMHEDYSITFQVWSDDLSYIWSITVPPLEEQDIISDKIEVVSQLGPVNEKQVHDCALGCPRGFAFIDHFIQNVEKYIHTLPPIDIFKKFRCTGMF